MAYVRADRVMETSSTTGTGAFTLAGAITGFRTFASVLSVSDTVHYYIELVGATGIPTGEWETGLGTYSGANTLTRTTVIASSNGGSAVNFSAGTKRVAISHITAAVLATQNNLSDLASASTARTNLGLVAGGAGDIWVEKAGDTMTGALTVTADSKALIVKDGGGPQTSVMLRVSGAAADEKDWEFLSNSGGDLQIRAINDAYTVAQTALKLVRGTGAVVDAIEFHSAGANRVQINNSGNIQMGGANTVIDSDRLFRLRSYTVATLPTVGTAGRLAAVTDANAPTYNATVAGGGAVNVPVYDNGTNWTAH